MTQREYEERILANAESFLEKHGLTAYVQSFLDSEMASKIIEEAFTSLMTEVERFKKSAPRDLAERAEKLWNTFNNAKAAFHKDAVSNLKIKIHATFALLPEPIKHAMIESGIMKDAFKVGSQKFSEDLTEICNDMKNRHVHSFMEFLYEDYIPQGMPQNVATFIKMLGGGCSVIPLSALIPEFNNEEENETDKENNATTTSEATVNAE